MISTPKATTECTTNISSYESLMNWYKQSKQYNFLNSKLKSNVDEKPDEVAMNHLKENVLSEMKQLFPTKSREKESDQILIESLKEILTRFKTRNPFHVKNWKPKITFQNLPSHSRHKTAEPFVLPISNLVTIRRRLWIEKMLPS